MIRRDPAGPNRPGRTRADRHTFFRPRRHPQTILWRHLYARYCKSRRPISRRPRWSVGRSPAPHRTGRGFSHQFVARLRDITTGQRLSPLIIPERSLLKHRYSLTPLKRYIKCRRDGLPFDLWLRVHVRACVRHRQALPTCHDHLRTVGKWERWARHGLSRAAGTCGVGRLPRDRCRRPCRPEYLGGTPMRALIVLAARRACTAIAPPGSRCRDLDAVVSCRVYTTRINQERAIPCAPESPKSTSPPNPRSAPYHRLHHARRTQSQCGDGGKSVRGATRLRNRRCCAYGEG